MISLFKKKERVYPSVYNEWITEFKRLDTTFLTEQDTTLLRSGGLKDSKYSLTYFKRELSVFLEKQIKMFFRDFSKGVQEHAFEIDSDYLLLVIRRNILKYDRLFFFENLDFLPTDYRKELKEQIKNKLTVFETELLDYFDKISLYSPSMYDVSLNIRRLI